MPLGNGSVVTSVLPTIEVEENVAKECCVSDIEEVGTLEGVDFTKFVKVEYVTPDEAKRLAEESRARERPIDYQYIEQMEKEGVTEEIAVRAFVGRFGGNENQTKFFLNSRFYYGSDAPTPLDRLRKAVAEGTIPECIETLEQTKEALERGAHF